MGFAAAMGSLGGCLAGCLLCSDDTWVAFRFSKNGGSFSGGVRVSGWPEKIGY